MVVIIIIGNDMECNSFLVNIQKGMRRVEGGGGKGIVFVLEIRGFKFFILVLLRIIYVFQGQINELVSDFGFFIYQIKLLVYLVFFSFEIKINDICCF